MLLLISKFITLLSESGVHDISSLVFAEISSVAYHVINLRRDLVCIFKEYISLFVEKGSMSHLLFKCFPS